MAKFHPEHDISVLLDAAQQWCRDCLVSDGSLFVRDLPVWTGANAAELDRDFVQHLDTGEGDFLGKLEIQLAPSSPDAKRLAAEMLWSLLLFQSNIRPPKKREIVTTVWRWSGTLLPPDHDLLSDAVMRGVGNPGQGFNAFRWKELAYLVGLTQTIKALDENQRRALVADAWQFGKWVQDLKTDGNRQFPNILRYLIHPLVFERITSGLHKRKIIVAFTGVPLQTLDNVSEVELDRRLIDVRQQIASAGGSADFDFYQPELAARWNPPSRAWLLSWNPRNWKWDDFQDKRRRTAAGEPVRMRWSCVAKSVQTGDGAYLIRAGVEPRGLAAKGVVVRPSFEDVHYDLERASRGEMARYIELEFSDIRDPAEDEFLSVQDLRERVSADQTWSPQSSGIGIPPDVAEALEAAWADLKPVVVVSKPPPPTRPPPRLRFEPPSVSVDQALEDLFVDRTEFLRIMKVWSIKKNVVLQGAPGVGKSFVAKRLAYALIGAADPERVETVQFHQSYGYEDFVQGYRPTSDGSFSLRDGVFFRFCEKARADEMRPYVFLIDEINRGNLSKIFGELMLLIEHDKRGKEWAVRLAYARPEEAPFSVPKNLHVLGMMNTADRSLSLVDYALRRRFAFITLEPAFDTEAFTDFLMARDVPAVVVGKIIRGMTALNQEIADDTANLGAGFRVGHSFFVPSENFRYSEGWFEQVIETEVWPLLEEYWFDNPRKARDWRDRLLATEG